jgi:hypothetical protein
MDPLVEPDHPPIKLEDILEMHRQIHDRNIHQQLQYDLVELEHTWIAK